MTTPFTNNWIQALTAASSYPVARSIKPLFEMLDRLSRNGSSDVEQAARELWALAEKSPLQEVLAILPTHQLQWTFKSDDIFSYTLREKQTVTGLETWCEQTGIKPSAFKLTASVVSSDWTGLVRSESVRLQKSFDSSAFSSQTNSELPCTARWSTQGWTIGFDQIPWIEIQYEDPVSVNRPDFRSIDEAGLVSMVEAESRLLPKQTRVSEVDLSAIDWKECVPTLSAFHENVLGRKGDFARFRKAWSCVWPIVYRERNLLRGVGDLDVIRPGIADCLLAVPDLTMWMFVFARIVIQFHTGPCLGHCADYSNTY